MNLMVSEKMFEDCGRRTTTDDGGLHTDLKCPSGTADGHLRVH